MSNIVLDARNISKSYQQGSETLTVLNGINMSIHAGERVAIVGTSGSGKSTLLNVLGGLDLPDSGWVRLLQHDLLSCNASQRGVLRNSHLGFVYQFHHLLPEFSAVENVALPLMISGLSKGGALETASELLERVGLSSRAKHKPSQLSGGERQRIAIARALACQPQCVLMDEPTGNLDQDNADSIHQLMIELNDTLNTSFVVVTHNEQLARQMDRVLRLNKGQLIQDA